MNNLQQLINIAELFLVIVTNPLESIKLNDYDLSTLPLHSLENRYYIAPDDGVIEDVINDTDGYHVFISLNALGNIVYPGLSEVTKVKGDKICKGEIIGKDNTILEDTKFIIMLFENLHIFPQIKNVTVTFPVDRGTPVYSISDAYLIQVGYDDQEAGLYTIFHLKGNEIIVKYQHLMALVNHGGFADQGKKVSYSGFTGASLYPQLSLNFYGPKIEKGIKIIYWKPVKKDETQE